MKYLVPLTLALLLMLPACASTLDVAPGMELYQSAEDADGRTVEQRQGARVRLGTLSTEAPTQPAERAAEDFKDGADSQREAGGLVHGAARYAVLAASVFGGLILLAVVILALALIFRKK